MAFSAPSTGRHGHWTWDLMPLLNMTCRWTMPSLRHGFGGRAQKEEESTMAPSRIMVTEGAWAGEHCTTAPSTRTMCQHLTLLIVPWVGTRLVKGKEKDDTGPTVDTPPLTPGSVPLPSYSLHGGHASYHLPPHASQHYLPHYLHIELLAHGIWPSSHAPLPLRLHKATHPPTSHPPLLCTPTTYQHAGLLDATTWATQDCIHTYQFSWV